MKLTDDERAILEGRDGPAKQAAMELIVKYGIALGADRLLDTKNVACGFLYHYSEDKIPGIDPEVYDTTFAVNNMGCDVCRALNMKAPTTATNTTTLGAVASLDYLRYCNAPQELIHKMEVLEEFRKDKKFHDTRTCVPYLAGNVPMRGEHCAWGESSAVIFINSVLGARTNCEGIESSGAAAIVGKIPNAGLHVTENRYGTHLVRVEKPPRTPAEWDLMGYYCGKAIEEGIPVFVGDFGVVTLDNHKNFGAALSTMGGIDMYHMVGYTPEAPTLEAAFGGRQPKAELVYGQAEEDSIRALLDSGKTDDVDLVLLGCPFYSINQIRAVADMLEGKKIKEGVHLIVMTAWMTKELAIRSGYAKVIEDAGGYISVDSCPPVAQVWPQGVSAMATDSAKMVQYGGAHRNDFSIHFGDVDRCINAALTGKW